MSNTDNQSLTTVALDRARSLHDELLGGHTAAAPDTDAAELCELVANDRRRRVLRILAAGEPMSMGELAERLAAREHAVAVAEVTADQRKRTYVSVYQTHVPRLEQAGLVTTDRDTVIPEAGIGAALEVYRTAAGVAGGDGV